MLFCLQVFYHLGEHNDSLSYALGAGTLFDVNEDSDYVHTVLGKYSNPCALYEFYLCIHLVTNINTFCSSSGKDLLTNLKWFAVSALSRPKYLLFCVVMLTLKT